MVALDDSPVEYGDDRNMDMMDATGTCTTDDEEQTGRKMTYNEWRQMRKRRKTLKAPEILTRLQSLEVDRGYSVQLSVVVSGCPEPNITWALDDVVIEEGDHFSITSDVSQQKYTLLISHITRNEEGTYRCRAENSEGSCSTMGFITVKDTSRQRKKRSVSRRPLISTIKEWQSVEDKECDPEADQIILRNRHCWDWWNLGAASDDDCYEKNKENISSTEEQPEREEKIASNKDGTDTKQTSATNLTKSKSRSLPDISPQGVIEGPNIMKHLVKPTARTERLFESGMGYILGAVITITCLLLMSDNGSTKLLTSLVYAVAVSAYCLNIIIN